MSPTSWNTFGASGINDTAWRPPHLNRTRLTHSRPHIFPIPYDLKNPVMNNTRPHCTLVCLCWFQSFHWKTHITIWVGIMTWLRVCIGTTQSRRGSRRLIRVIPQTPYVFIYIYICTSLSTVLFLLVNRRTISSRRRQPQQLDTHNCHHNCYHDATTLVSRYILVRFHCHRCKQFSRVQNIEWVQCVLDTLHDIDGILSVFHFKVFDFAQPDAVLTSTRTANSQRTLDKTITKGSNVAFLSW